MVKDNGRVCALQPLTATFEEAARMLPALPPVLPPVAVPPVPPQPAQLAQAPPQRRARPVPTYLGIEEEEVERRCPQEAGFVGGLLHCDCADLRRKRG